MRAALARAVDDPELEGKIRVTVIATGFNREESRASVVVEPRHDEHGAGVVNDLPLDRTAVRIRPRQDLDAQ